MQIVRSEGGLFGLLFLVPTVQLGNSNITLDRAVIETIFQHVLVRLANQRSRFNAEQLHDFVTVQIRADRVEILLLLQIAHALFHLVHRRREHHGLALVLRGRVGTRQAVQTLVQRACVFDVTADRGIRPRLLHVSVETQVKVDQFADVLDHMMIEMQCLKALAGHFRADRIMMMETHLAARFETTRLRLADIVHERGKTQRQVWSWHRTVRAGFESDSTINDDHGVLEHVLMTMMFVDFELQCRNFREDDDDYYTQPGLLFRLMSPAQQKVLFENTARSIGDAPKEIKVRHIGNCLKADPAYGRGVADALGISLDEVK